MAYLLRLIAAFIFFFAGANVWAQSCSTLAILTFPPFQSPGTQFVCNAGCIYERYVDEEDGTENYGGTGESCDPVEDGDDGSGNGGNPGNGDPGNGDPGNGNPGNGNPGNGDPGNGDPGNGDPGNGENPGNGNPGNGNPGNVDPLACKNEDHYWHHCIDSDGDYWIYDDYIDACPSSNDGFVREEVCAVREEDSIYFRYESYHGARFTYGDYFNALYIKCDYENDDDHLYCANRYLSDYESNLYDNAFSEFANNNGSGTNSDDDDDDDDDEGGDSKTIDLRTRLGISENGDGSLSSTIPDLLGHVRPNKSGAHGVCLDDITLEIGNQEIVLEISRVCEWLKTLGTIFVFISLFIAIQIIVRD